MTVSDRRLRSCSCPGHRARRQAKRGAGHGTEGPEGLTVDGGANVAFRGLPTEVS